MVGDFRIGGQGMRQFERTIGIDYSGRQTADKRLKQLQVYETWKNSEPDKVRPPEEPGHNWTRRILADWLKEELKNSPPTIVGIDHAFSFPKVYFETHVIPFCWDSFLDDFRKHWPTHHKDVIPYHLNRSGGEKVDRRRGQTKWYRGTEMHNDAKSVFLFDVPGQVAMSTHAGLPFLWELRKALPKPKVHFWPFDGWEVPSGKSCLVEAYPNLYHKYYPREGSYTGDEWDAYVTAKRMRDADQKGNLKALLNPVLPDSVKAAAQYEGWILEAKWPDD